MEEILNSRPFTYTSSEDIEGALTPSHLLHGFRLMNMFSSDEVTPTNDYFEINDNQLSKCMMHLKNVKEHLWRKWRSEYLLELGSIHRWLPTESQSPLKCDDVVLIHDENS